MGAAKKNHGVGVGVRKGQSGSRLGSFTLGKRFRSPIVFDANDILRSEPTESTPWWCLLVLVLFRKDELPIEGFLTS